MSFVEKFGISTQRQLTDEELAELNGGAVYGKETPETGLSSALPHGLDQTLGMTFTAVGPERVEGRIVIDQRHVQPWGVTNGGVYCAIGESIASIAGYIAAGGQATVMGVNNNTDFFRPSRPGASLREIAPPV